MKKGALFIEALITLVIIIFAFGIAFVPSWNLMKKTKENEELLNLKEILLNKCEEYTYLNASSIPPQITKELYKGKEYTIKISKETISSKDLYTVTSNSTYIIYPDIVVLTIRVISESGKYIEAQVVPQQW